MGSSEGEVFQLREPVAVDGAVEVWMTAVENEMTNSLRSITKEGVFRYASEERQDWITAVLGMVSLVGSQIWWTWEVRRLAYCNAGTCACTFRRRITCSPDALFLR